MTNPTQLANPQASSIRRDVRRPLLASSPEFSYRSRLRAVSAFAVVFALVLYVVPQLSADDTTVPDYRHVATWSADTDQKREFSPLDIAIDDQDHLYVADVAGNQVLVYDGEGRQVDSWGAPAVDGRCDGVFVPYALDIDRDRHQMYVLWFFYARPLTSVPRHALVEIRSFAGDVVNVLSGDSFARDLAVNPSTGEPWYLYPGAVSPIGGEFKPTSGNREFPGSLAFLPNGWLVMVKRIGSVEIMTPDGIELGELDLRGYSPLSVATNKDGSIFVLVRAQSEEHRDVMVLQFDADGMRSGETTASELAIPPPREGNWPLTLAVHGSEMAASSADEHFVVGRTSTTAIRGGAVESRFDTPSTSGTVLCEPAPMSIVSVAEASIGVLEGDTAKLVTIDSAGEATLLAELGISFVDASHRGEALYVITATGDVERRMADRPDDVMWSSPCSCLPGGRVDALENAVVVTRPKAGAFALYTVDTGQLVAEFQPGSPQPEWPYDVAAFDRNVLLADLYGKQLEEWATDGSVVSRLASGFVTGPRRVGLAGSGDQALSVAALLDGSLEVYRPATESLVARWRLDNPGPYVSDVAIAESGTVFVADGKRRHVHVYEPSVGALPTPVPGAPTATPSEYGCLVAGSKIAGPAQIPLGATVDVTLTIRANCPVTTREVGADIVLVLDTSASVGGAPAARRDAIVRGLVDLIDMNRHRLAVVAFSARSRLAVPLTGDKHEVLTSLADLESGGGTIAQPALALAADHLSVSGRAGALPTIIFLSDGGGDSSATIATASDLRSQGIQLFAVGLSFRADHHSLSAIAGRPERYYYVPSDEDLLSIYMQLLHWVTTSSAGDWTIDDVIGDKFQYVAGSSVPPAVEASEDRRLRWRWTVLSGQGVTVTYKVRPTEIGLLNTNEVAVARYTDVDGSPREFIFPVPQIEVVAPTATPTATATPVPAPIYLPFALARRAADPSRVFLPRLIDRLCVPDTWTMDVALVIDASSSMLTMSGDGNKTKMDRAVEAALHFIRLLGPADQAAVISFHEAATLDTPLTSDKVTLERGLQQISNGDTTRLDLGLKLARQELLSVRRRTGNQPVMIVLTDGKANPVPVSVAEEEASISKSSGIAIFTVGLGQPDELDNEALGRIASRVENYYQTPDADDLQSIYEQIAVAIPCPGG